MQTRIEYQRRINLALRYIESSYAENIRLEDIAAAAQFSPYHFHRLFTILTGETPLDFLRRIRLEKAAALLKVQPERPITQIALETGFSSPTVFARAFKTRFSLSAREFRKKTTPGGDPSGSPSNFALQEQADLQMLEPLELRQMPALRMAYARNMKGYGMGIDAAWKKILSWAFPRGYMKPGIHLYGIPLDDPEVTPVDRCRYFAAVPIPADAKPDGLVELWIQEAGWYAVFPFQGRMKDFSSFYQRIYGAWLPGSGYLPDDRPALEEYAFARSSSPEPVSPSEQVFEFSLLLPVRPL
jgi:AraC family transcriptional regulator